MPTTRFLVANAILVVAALLLARVGWRHPALSLIIPSATLINAVFFHILPTIVQGRVAPGVYTAALFYVPFSSWALIGAARDGVRPHGDCDRVCGRRLGRQRGRRRNCAQWHCRFRRIGSARR